MSSWIRGAGALVAIGLLAGCAALDERKAGPDDLASSPWASASAGPGARAQWSHQRFPGKAAVNFHYVRQDGRHSMSATSDAAASMLRRNVRVEPAQLARLRFSWKVPALIAEADLARRDADDSPVRIVLVFEGDRSRFSQKDAVLSELARALTGEELPYATLMYVWCNKRPAGSVVHSPRTDRIRKIVVQSGPEKLDRWMDYERDIRADYERAFGEKPGALVGIGIMTDSDNTHSRTRAWYGPVGLQPLASAR